MVGECAGAEDRALHVALLQVVDAAVGVLVDTVVVDTFERPVAVLAYEFFPCVEVAVAGPVLVGVSGLAVGEM